MNQDQVKAIFLLAHIEVENLEKVRNEYWPDPSDFDELRKEVPWWLVKTEFGVIKIGWRKRVINIDWEATGMRLREKFSYDDFEFWERGLTLDDVTKSSTIIHADGYGKAIEYLSELKLRSKQWEYAHSEEGKEELAERRIKEEKYKAEREARAAGKKFVTILGADNVPVYG